MPKLLQLPVQPRYQDERVKLYCADCRDVLPKLVADSAVTDPPYGNGTAYNSFNDNADNVLIVVERVIQLLRRVVRSTCITSGNGLQGLYPPPDWTMAWFTPAGTGSGPWGFCCWQPILCYGKCPYLSKGLGRRQDAIVHTESSEKNGHPCPKPLGFMEWLVDRASLSGETIIDPFMGSGTTGVACVRTGRKFVGVEIDPEYYAIAEHRIRMEIAKLKPCEPPVAPEFDDPFGAA